MKIHTGEKQFTCNICTASFLSHEELRGHRKKEHRVKKTIKCKRCQESFATEGQLEDHKVSHLLSCPFCQKTFKNKTNLQIHINFHNNPPICDICQRDCKTYGRLKHHKLTHTKKNLTNASTVLNLITMVARFIIIRGTIFLKPHNVTFAKKRFQAVKKWLCTRTISMEMQKKKFLVQPALNTTPRVNV